MITILKISSYCEISIFAKNIAFFSLESTTFLRLENIFVFLIMLSLSSHVENRSESIIHSKHSQILRLKGYYENRFLHKKTNKKKIITKIIVIILP